MRLMQVVGLLMLLAGMSFGQLSRATFVSRIKDGHHVPSKVEVYSETEPVEIRDMDVVLSDVVLSFPLRIYNGTVKLRNVTAREMVGSRIEGDLDVTVGGEGVDIALSLIGCNNLRVTGRFGRSRIAIQSMPGDAGTFPDTAARAGLGWKPENVWRYGTNLAGQGPNGVDPVFVGNGTNRVTVPTPAWPEPGWFQFSVPKAQGAVVMVEGLPSGAVRWVNENTIEWVGGTFAIGQRYRYHSYFPEFLSRRVTIENAVFEDYSLAGVNVFWMDEFVARDNFFRVAVPDDATILPEETFRTVLMGNVRVPRDPRGVVASWDDRGIGFIGTMVDPVAVRNVGMRVNAQNRGRPAWGYVGDVSLNWVGGPSRWQEWASFDHE